MPLIWLILGLAQAAKPHVPTLPRSVSRAEKDRGFPTISGRGVFGPVCFASRTMPAAVFPEGSRQRPEVVAASIWVKPNVGQIRIEYAVNEERTPQLDKMLAHGRTAAHG